MILNSKTFFGLPVVFTVVIVGLLNGVNVQAVQEATPSTKQNCDRSVMDDCSGRLLILGHPNATFPRNINEMNARCKTLKSLEKCVKDYASNCLTREAKQPISVLIYSITRSNKAYCQTAKRKQAFLAIGACANINRKRLDDFFETMNRDNHAIKTYKEKKHRIPMTCCSYYNMKEKIMSRIGEKCNEQLVPEAEGLLDGYAKDILSLLCGDYTEDSDKCDALYAKIPKWTKALKSQNFLMPLADVLNSL